MIVLSIGKKTNYRLFYDRQEIIDGQDKEKFSSSFYLFNDLEYQNQISKKSDLQDQIIKKSDPNDQINKKKYI